MRSSNHKYSTQSSNAPVYTFDTDTVVERVIRDPMSVLLGRSRLQVQQDVEHTDPYNRVGRWARAR